MLLKEYLTNIGLPNTFIRPSGEVCQSFLNRNITTLWDAILHVQQLPYGRNTDRANYSCVLEENKGTCSTKHALIAKLAQELGISLYLSLGLFFITRENKPTVSAILDQYNLPAIPEAHCFLRYASCIIDITSPNATAFSFSIPLEREVSLTPEQIGDFKLAQHKHFIDAYIQDKQNITFDLVWAAREQWINSL